jgi:hypothetical protein
MTKAGMAVQLGKEIKHNFFSSFIHFLFELKEMIMEGDLHWRGIYIGHFLARISESKREELSDLEAKESLEYYYNVDFADHCREIYHWS